MKPYFHLLIAIVYGAIAAFFAVITTGSPNAGLATIPLMTGLAIFSTAGVIHLAIQNMASSKKQARQMLVLTRALHELKSNKSKSKSNIEDEDEDEDDEDDRHRFSQVSRRNTGGRPQQNQGRPLARRFDPDDEDDDDDLPPNLVKARTPQSAQKKNPPPLNSERASRESLPLEEEDYDEEGEDDGNSEEDFRIQPSLTNKPPAQEQKEAEESLEASDLKKLRSLITQLYSGDGKISFDHIEDDQAEGEIREDQDDHDNATHYAQNNQNQQPRQNYEFPRKRENQPAPTAPNEPYVPAMPKPAVTEPMARQIPTPPRFSRELDEGQLMMKVKQALFDQRVALKLQPIVSLPSRQVVYQECFSSLYDEHGLEIGPERFLGVATKEGLLPTVDQLLLFHLLRHLNNLVNRQKQMSYFCNISDSTIRDPAFFKQFLSQLEANPGIISSLIMEVSQASIDQGEPELIKALKMLKGVGFRLSLDRVSNPEHAVDIALRMGFSFIKMRAPLLMVHLETKLQSRQAANGLIRDWRDQGLELITERVESETGLKELMEYDVRLAQGYLFGAPEAVA